MLASTNSSIPLPFSTGKIQSGSPSLFTGEGFGVGIIRRIALIKPCCIGDVIMATALLTALQRGYPDADIDWIVGSSAASALRGHPDLRNVIDSGPRANPAARPDSLLRLVNILRHANYDLAVVPDRSALLGVAVLLAGIPRPLGLNRGGTGVTFNFKKPIAPFVVSR